VDSRNFQFLKPNCSSFGTIVLWHSRKLIV
jgi:hypothetical protein